MPDEQAIIARIADGDQHALHELYTIYRPRLRRYLWRQLQGDQGLVEEALQDIFLSVWRSAGTFRHESQVGTWLFRIARHRVSHLRRDTAHRPEGHLVHIDEGDDESAAPLHIISHEDAVIERLALGDALSQLSEKHREVLDLIFRYGFSLAEVAQILEIPAGTVKSRINYARRALMRELATATAREEEQP
jgi:RNA polymerase sigma-70 factor, ECF subfamily